MTKKHPDNNKDDQLEQIKYEMEAMKIQMLGQMVLIQNLSRGQEELRALVSKLHQEGCNHMEQTTRIGDRVFNQPQLKQEDLVEKTPFKMAATPRVQQRPRQPQWGNQ